MKFKLLIPFVILFFVPFLAHAYDQGIYVTSTTAENTKAMDNLIKQAKAAGINTFVIDVYNRSKPYTANVNAVRQNGIKYIARVVVFPYGGTPNDIHSQTILEKRWKWANYAIELGASAIQLDYVRFKPSQSISDNNVAEIHRVIKYFKNKLAGTGVQLQVDVFGIAGKGPSKRIGQDISVFAQTIDAICPMVYPSHYEPYKYYALRPYQAIQELVGGVKKQISSHPNVKLIPFIELYNYRYPLSNSERIRYIQEQLRAVKDIGTSGWYAWNEANKYESLFYVLKLSQGKAADAKKEKQRSAVKDPTSVSAKK